MQKLALGLVALFFAAALSSPAYAATPVVVSATVDPFVATVGDRLALTIVVDHDPGTKIEGPALDADFGGSEAIARADPETTKTDSVERTTLVYTLVSFTTGPAVVPPLQIAWKAADGGTGVVPSPAAAFTVDSVLQPGTDTLRPLKPQLDIPQPAPPPVVPATFVAIMAGLTALGYWLVRRTIALRPELPAPLAPAPPPTPAEAARKALDAIARADLAAFDPSAFYGAIAAAVRQYLSARFDFPAYAMTRREMEQGMRRAGIDRWPARLTTNLLEQCVAVQFAMFRPAPDRRAQDLAAAYEIIKLTAEPARLTEGRAGQPL